MQLSEREINICDQRFVFTNQRVMFWPKAHTLILSDMHVGKTAHFRKYGMAIPAEIMANDLNRLAMLIQHYQVQRLIITGDFLHAGNNTEVSAFQVWKQQFPDLHIILVKGNHDKLSNHFLNQLGIQEVYTFYEESNIAFSHDVVKNCPLFQIYGHIHPGVSLSSTIQRNLKYPCFILTEKELILPAYNVFTGLDTKNHPKDASYYFFSEEGIFQI